MTTRREHHCSSPLNREEPPSTAAGLRGIALRHHPNRAKRPTQPQCQSASPAGSKRKLEFEYDWRGRRIKKVSHSAWNGSSYAKVATTNFIYDGWNLLAELDASNNVIRSYVWGTDLSGTMQGAGGVGGLLFVKESDGTPHFAAYDGNGNVMGLVKGTDGTRTATYEYDPFGQPLRATGSIALANPMRFSTKFTDNETGLIYYGYRYYIPSAGTWPNRDPMGELGFGLLRRSELSEAGEGPNLYAFVGNSPLNYVDELGLAYGNPVSGPNGPVGPSDPWSPGGAYWTPTPPQPPSCVGACVAQHLLGITIDTIVIVSGQPILKKRFILPGSSEGTSIAGKVTDAILQDAKLPGRWPTISAGCCPRIAYTKPASRFVSRWIPFVGWGLLTYDAAGLAGCICGCKGI